MASSIPLAGCPPSIHGHVPRCMAMDGRWAGLGLNEDAAYLVDKCRHCPGQRRCVYCREGCPPPRAAFALYGSNGGQAREVEQYEDEIAEGYEGRNAVGSHLLVKGGVFRLYIFGSNWRSMMYLFDSPVQIKRLKFDAFCHVQRASPGICCTQYAFSNAGYSER